MIVKNAFMSLLLGLADLLAALVPQSTPGREALKNCKIVSHRGEHDNTSVIENTLPAFRLARDRGVPAIECDIRWTADLVPVISHDPDGVRVFNSHLKINRITFDELRKQISVIPSLAELIAEFGGNTHLMLEIKAEKWPRPRYQKDVLEKLLADLVPGTDYHFLLLDPGLLPRVDFVATDYCFLVSEANTRRISQQALDNQCAGLAGHFYLLSNSLIKRHEIAGQSLGTGFVNSRHCLFRELNRGIEWIFSNKASSVQGIVDQLRKEYAAVANKKGHGKSHGP